MAFLGLLAYRIDGIGKTFGIPILLEDSKQSAVRLTELYAVTPASVGSESRQAQHMKEQVVALYERYRAPLYRYLLSLGFLTQDAEEITQEVFLRLYRHLHKGGDAVALQAWVYRVAYNLAVNFRKTQKRHGEISPDSWPYLKESLSSGEATPEEQVLHRERMNRVLRALEELTPLQRDCIHLRVEGLRYKDIAQVLNTTTVSVSTALRGAITRITREYL